jgi:hypothetical protein
MIELKYRFLHEGTSMPAHTVTIDDNSTWEDVRYLLEKRHCMHSNHHSHKKSRYSTGDSFFIGWKHHSSTVGQEYRKLPILSGKYVLKRNDTLVLSRQWMPPNKTTYIPLKFRKRTLESDTQPDPSEMDDTHLTEEQRLDEMFNQMDKKRRRELFVKRREQQHQSHASETSGAPPPRDYTCVRCQQKGDHWKDDCPTWSEPDYTPVRVLKPPTGIPKSMLRLATSDQDKSMAMKTSDGQLVVKII